MVDVQFFHQERVDGGRRSGVSVDGTTILHGFLPGSEEYDPALVWYADVTVPSSNPPTEANAPSWLVSRGQTIRDALIAAAGKLECGIDNNAMPWELQVPGSDGPIRVSVASVRRFSARSVGEKLRWLATQDWNAFFPSSTYVG